MKYLLIAAGALALVSCGNAPQEEASELHFTPQEGRVTEIRASVGSCSMVYVDTDHNRYGVRVYAGDHPDLYRRCIALNVEDPIPILVAADRSKIQWESITP